MLIKSHLAIQSVEDYSYFHLVPDVSNPTTIFGISWVSTWRVRKRVECVYRCNRQIASSTLLVKGVDVTRSIVQKAVVVLASKPVFGPIRLVDKLCPCAQHWNLSKRSTGSRHKGSVCSKVRSVYFTPLASDVNAIRRDFSDTEILVEFGNSLEVSLRTQLTESGLYIGQQQSRSYPFVISTDLPDKGTSL